ncbi:MAG TPA: tyrosine-type recombinase/integrase [Pyrinomonadaceae bacterium]|nr:tyrosine-type recombinase/integrase [Pyrinomonadaceae bacterium]
MKIWKQYNKQKKRNFWHARFRLNGKQFVPTAETRTELDDLLAEIRNQEKIEKDNKKYNLNKVVPSYIPTVSELLDEVKPTIPKHHQRTLAERVFNIFTELLPPETKVDEIKKTHFQIYIKHRSAQVGKQTKQPVKLATIYKELYALSSALKQAPIYYDALEKWQMPELPELPKGFKKKSKRERLVTDKELSAIIAKLTEQPTGKQTFAHYFHRVRLAHQIEFGYWTGLRRKEIARLKFAQYDEEQQALLNVKRWKTDTVTKLFPLGKRAIEIIEERRKLQNGCEYVFTPDGEPIESNYRTMKQICEELKIPYGRYADGGFVAHDLRHNFGTEILRATDIETARELLGHSNISQTGTYVHTSTERMREAVRKREKIDYNTELENVFNEIINGNLDLPKFKSEIKNLFQF